VSPTLGFDLDMTLVDTRPGIAAALRALARDTGRPIDVDAVVGSLGPPVAQALAPWFAESELPAAVEVFREHMTHIGVMNVAPLPGAAEAVASARAHGLRVLVVTSKVRRLATATLDHAGLAVDHVVGDVWGADKASPLRAAAAIAFVGDHPADMVAAGRAGIAGIGVSTGSSSPAELAGAGAAVVLASLGELPALLPELSSAAEHQVEQLVEGDLALDRDDVGA
jgi:phosphoglycolate phosphatase